MGLADLTVENIEAAARGDFTALREELTAMAEELAAEGKTVDGFQLTPEQRAEFDGIDSRTLRRQIAQISTELAIREHKPVVAITDSVARASARVAERVMAAELGVVLPA